jgi:hypothetical protein
MTGVLMAVQIAANPLMAGSEIVGITEVSWELVLGMCNEFPSLPLGT